MKLYDAPATCSIAPHIVLRQAGLAFALEKVDTGHHVTANGGDCYAVNAKGTLTLA